MLANLLKSPKAIQASIQVVRAFVHLRRMLAANEDIAHRLQTIERKIDRHDAELQSIPEYRRCHAGTGGGSCAQAADWFCSGGALMDSRLDLLAL